MVSKTTIYLKRCGRRWILLTGLLVLVSLCMDAQQLPLYSQYMMNRFLINPAVAGSEGYTAFNLTAREQWIGLKYSPKTHAFSAQTRILRKSFISRGASVRRKKKGSSRSGKVGVGGYVFNDQSGLVNRTGLQLTYAYHISFRRGQLSFGLSGSFYQFRVDREKIILYDPSDDLINNFNNRLWVPDANIGVYYSDPRMYGGLSVSDLFQASFKFGREGYDNFRLLRHYYAIGGINFELSDYLIFEPSFLIKASEVWSMQADITAKMYIYDNYWAGLSYRTGSALIIMGGLRLDKFYLGYAFDYTLSSIQRHSYGSHEFILAVKLGDSARRYKWLIRY
jgi:type IX secretion system PorP/SprF family membrane protein